MCRRAGAISPGGGIYGGGGATQTGTTAATAATGATGETGTAADATVSLSNYQFSPADLEVASGTVLEVVNANRRTPHTFTVVGEDVDVELGPIESETTDIDLEPGTYDVICRFHEGLGMTGTLTVT